MAPRCCCLSHHALPSVAAIALLASTMLTNAATDTQPCASLQAPIQPIQPVIGVIETVRLMDIDIELNARIDTGAGLTSMDATIIEIMKSDQPSQPDRIVFMIQDGAGGTRTLEKDIVDWVKIKKKGAPGSMRRPVVIMTICLAHQAIADRVNLAERKGFSYPILIGRHFLKNGRFLVDSELSSTHVPACQQ
ncbi:RimK/LysX family protein [uncultured Thiocystis sp.]|jgi:hypothetical protein|uniref:putative ATP-dependent zinc protease n=1 Tax=uncultured Thiocystis sp. TaxID=1202134 RepID=UPI0025D0E50E|nr:RimK/LysX family protein [uncultured Thiocystis sp.]